MTILIFIAAIVVASSASAHVLAPFQLKEQAAPAPSQDVSDEGELLPPMIDLGEDTIGPDEQRVLKSRRYNHRSMLCESPCDGVVFSSEHWWAGMPALPVAKSDLIVVGTVADARAFLSEDQKGIYSEYGVRVERVLLARVGSDAVTAGVAVNCERDGGRVRWPDGKVERYSVRGQGIPRIGARYALFLKRNPDSDYRLLLGYELKGAEVQPLDSGPTEEYRGASEASFLQAVSSASGSDAPQPPN